MGTQQPPLPSTRQQSSTKTATSTKTTSTTTTKTPTTESKPTRKSQLSNTTISKNGKSTPPTTATGSKTTGKSPPSDTTSTPVNPTKSKAAASTLKPALLSTSTKIISTPILPKSTTSVQTPLSTISISTTSIQTTTETQTILNTTKPVERTDSQLVINQTNTIEETRGSTIPTTTSIAASFQITPKIKLNPTVESNTTKILVPTKNYSTDAKPLTSSNNSIKPFSKFTELIEPSRTVEHTDKPPNPTTITPRFMINSTDTVGKVNEHLANASVSLTESSATTVLLGNIVSRVCVLSSMFVLVFV